MLAAGAAGKGGGGDGTARQLSLRPAPPRLPAPHTSQQHVRRGTGTPLAGRRHGQLCMFARDRLVLIHGDVAVRLARPPHGVGAGLEPVAHRRSSWRAVLLRKALGLQQPQRRHGAAGPGPGAEGRAAAAVSSGERWAGERAGVVSSQGAAAAIWPPRNSLGFAGGGWRAAGAPGSGGDRRIDKECPAAPAEQCSGLTYRRHDYSECRLGSEGEGRQHCCRGKETSWKPLPNEPTLAIDRPRLQSSLRVTRPRYVLVFFA